MLPQVTQPNPQVSHWSGIPGWLRRAHKQRVWMMEGMEGAQRALLWFWTTHLPPLQREAREIEQPPSAHALP